MIIKGTGIVGVRTYSTFSDCWVEIRVSIADGSSHPILRLNMASCQNMEDSVNPIISFIDNGTGTSTGTEVTFNLLFNPPFPQLFDPFWFSGNFMDCNRQAAAHGSEES